MPGTLDLHLVSRASTFAFTCTLSCLALTASAESSFGKLHEISVTCGHVSENARPLPAAIHVRCISAGCDRVRNLSIGVPWRGTLELDPNLEWQVAVDLPGYWAPVELLEPGAHTTINLLPTGVVRGQIQGPKTGAPPREVEARVESSLAFVHRLGKGTVPQSIFRCPIEEDTWRCEVPADIIDLRIEIKGFIPFYFWDVEVQPGDVTDLGSLRLDQGSSLAGWIEVTEEVDSDAEEAAPAVAGLQLQSIGVHMNTVERDRIALRTHQVKAGKRGFFQFRGLEEGGYILTVEKPGFSPSRIFPLTIEEGEETFLGEPVLLHRPVKLEVFLEPPVGPNGRPWIVQLLRQELNSEVSSSLAESGATLEGYWQYADLSLGEYFLHVMDLETSSVWLSEPLEVTAEMTPLFLEVEVVPIEGTIRAGDDPIQATLLFGGQQTPRILMKSDEDGRFKGYLPREGLWPIDLLAEGQALEQGLEDVEVRRRPGHRSAEIEISLPGTHLSGEVLEDGQPVAGVPVTLVRDGEQLRRGAILMSNDEGTFDLRGLPEGTYFVSASSGDRTSPWTPVSLQEDLESPSIRLELQKKVKLSGQIYSSSGTVPGAQVIAIPVGGDPQLAFAERSTSGVDGSFTLDIPYGSVAIDLLVVPPGFALQMRRVPLSPDGSDPLMLLVEPMGGKLVLQSRPSKGSSSVLHHDGAAIPVKFLVSLLLPTGVVSFGDSALTFHQMPQGDYSSCPIEVSEKEPCVQGFLPPNGQLELDS